MSNYDYEHKNMNGQPLCRRCGEYGYHEWCGRPTDDDDDVSRPEEE